MVARRSTSESSRLRRLIESWVRAVSTAKLRRSGWFTASARLDRIFGSKLVNALLLVARDPSHPTEYVPPPQKSCCRTPAVPWNRSVLSTSPVPLRNESGGASALLYDR